MSCTTDFHCKSDQYCDTTLNECVPVESSTRVCYRSENCPAGYFCGKPGLTELPNCATCPAEGVLHNKNQAGLNAHNCHCGDAKFCNNCHESKTKCLDCIEKYEKVGDLCVKSCEADQVLTEECGCNNVICPAGSKCIIEGALSGCVQAAIDCKIDSKCMTCEEADDKICKECIEGYELNEDKKCVAKRTCKTGSTAIEHCTECQTDDNLLCAKCDSSYDLVNNTCEAKLCGELIENCHNCIVETLTCIRCIDGYVVKENKCVESDNSCQNDFDCGDNDSLMYCNVAEGGFCQTYEKSTSVCYRTSECKGDNKYCKNPGKSEIGSCGTCTSSSSTVNLRGCNCGTALYCEHCDELSSNQECLSCITGYSKDEDGVCIKECAIDASITIGCSCQGITCMSGQTCTKDGCIGESDTDTCMIGPSKVEHCIKCQENDAKKCLTCGEEFLLNDVSGLCEARNDCVAGSSAVENCQECEAEDKFQCKTCKPDFHLDNGACKADTCLVGPHKVENCITCGPINVGQCIKCDKDMVLEDNMCVVSTFPRCGNDYDCKDSEICDIEHQCIPFEVHEKYCHRSSECKGDNKVCGKPGATWISSCGTCAEKWSDILDFKTCKCGEAAFCRICNTETLTCSECIYNYNMVDSVCVKSCDVGVVPAGQQCACDAVVCYAGSTCQQESDMSKTCIAVPTENDCRTGPSAIPHCVECDSVNKLNCKECNEAYDLIDNLCLAINDCRYGEGRIEDCAKCAVENDKVCAQCKSGFDLVEGKCKQQVNKNQTGLIIGCSVAAVIVVVVAVIVAVILIRKRKVNGAVKQDAASRKRNVEVPDDVHIPI